MTLLFSNNAETTLAAGLTASATTCNVQSGAGADFPQPSNPGDYFKLTFVDAATGVDTEICHCVSVSGDTLTIIRAQEGTQAQVWNAGDKASNWLTAGTMAAFAQNANIATSFYQGTDTGSDPNNMIIPSLSPANPSPSGGQVFIITKNSQNNNGTQPVSITTPSPGGTKYNVVYADGSNLLNGDWPGSSSAFVLFTGAVYQMLGFLIPLRPVDSEVWHTGTAAGTASAITTTLSPLPQVSSSNFFISVSVPNAFTNNPSATLTWHDVAGNTITAPIVLNLTGATTVGGELAQNSEANFFYDGTKARLLNSALAPASYQPAPEHSITFGSAASTSAYTTVGGSTGTISVVSAGVFNWTCPQGVTQVFAQNWAGGSGGGGSNGSVGGGGGGGGGYAEGIYNVVPGTVYTVIVGSGGVNGPGNGTGGAGGSSSFASFCSATASGPGRITLAPSYYGSGSGGTFNWTAGGATGGSSQPTGGNPGGSWMSPPLGVSAISGQQGVWPGGGGSGGGTNAGNVYQGGYGANGCVILRW